MIGFRLLLAFFVMLGTSGGGFAAMLCEVGACGTNCAQKITQVKQDQDSCCASKASKDEHGTAGEKRSSKCSCHLSAPTDVAQINVKLVAPQAPIVADLPQPAIEAHASDAIERAQSIFFHSDSSPPSVVRHPDLGRAPPVA